MDATEDQVCRLCFCSKINLIDLFNELNSNAVEIITQHIGEVVRTDALPKCICDDCWWKIDDFHKFHRSVHQAQQEYLHRNVKQEVDAELENSCMEANPIEFDCNPIENDSIERPNFVEVLADFDDFEQFSDGADEKHQFSDEADEKPQHKTLEIADLDDSRGDSDYVGDDESAQSGSESDSANAKDEIDPATGKEIFQKHFDTTCDLCPANLKTLKRAITHYMKEHNNHEGYIKCCGLKLKRNKLVDDHIRWHINPDIFKCEHCGKIMKTKLSLATHYTSHKHVKSFTCDICNKVFSQFSKLKIHMNSHAKSDRCEFCLKKMSRAKMEDHIKFFHNSDKVRQQLNAVQEAKKSLLDAEKIETVIATHFDFNCDHCELVFKSIQEAQYHYMHEHQIADGYIKCCRSKFKKICDIEGHVLWHLKPDLYRCKICGKENTTISSLRAHIRKHESRPPGPQNDCKECDKSFSGRKHFNRHMKSVHGIVLEKIRKKSNSVNPDTDSLKQFFEMNCEICKKELLTLQHAKLHYLEEHAIADGYIKCCDMKFKEVRQINDHLEYHMNPEIFTCNICSKLFPRKSDLSAHISQHKAVETKRFSCSECGKVWKSKYRLEKHKLTHGQKMPALFPCDYCNRKFKSEKLRKCHTSRIHLATKEEKTEICEYCAKTFAKRKEVLSHIRCMHSDKSARQERVQCEICNAWLSNRYTLKDHMIRHNAEPQKCSQCDKISPNHHALLCHVRDVHCDRTYQCHLCPKTFKAAVALKDHVATHTGEKMYKCSFCPEAFIWRPNMYSHQKKAHPVEWQKTKNDVRRRLPKV